MPVAQSYTVTEPSESQFICRLLSFFKKLWHQCNHYNSSLFPLFVLPSFSNGGFLANGRS
jgi:hypothetical protein